MLSVVFAAWSGRVPVGERSFQTRGELWVSQKHVPQRGLQPLGRAWVRRVRVYAGQGNAAPLGAAEPRTHELTDHLPQTRPRGGSRARCHAGQNLNSR